MENLSLQSVKNFQGIAVEEEENGNFHRALIICLNAMSVIENFLKDPNVSISQFQRLELRLSYGYALERSKFLLGVIELDRNNLFDDQLCTPSISGKLLQQEPAGPLLCFSDVEVAEKEKTTTIESIMDVDDVCMYVI